VRKKGINSYGVSKRIPTIAETYEKSITAVESYKKGTKGGVITGKMGEATVGAEERKGGFCELQMLSWE